MKKFNNDLEINLRKIENISPFSYGHMFFSSIGLMLNSELKLKMKISSQSQYFTIGFTVPYAEHFYTNEERTLNETTSLYDGTYYHNYIPKLLLNYYSYKSYTSYLSMDEIVKYCIYFPRMVDYTIENNSTVISNNYMGKCNHNYPLSKNNTQSFIAVRIHKDNVYDFLKDINNEKLNEYIQFITYHGDTSLLDDKKITLSGLLLSYELDDPITLNNVKRCDDEFRNMNGTGLMCTSTMEAFISKHTPYIDNVYEYIQSLYRNILKNNFVVVNFRINIHNSSGERLLVSMMEKHNIVPTRFNWNDKYVVGGIVHVPIESFEYFMNRLKLYEMSIVSIKYYPFFHI